MQLKETHTRQCLQLNVLNIFQTNLLQILIFMQRIKSSAPRREFSSYFQPLTMHMKLDFPSTILDNQVFSQNMLNIQYFFDTKNYGTITSPWQKKYRQYYHF